MILRARDVLRNLRTANSALSLCFQGAQGNVRAQISS
jgi:hypothetical protein